MSPECVSSSLLTSNYPVPHIPCDFGEGPFTPYLGALTMGLALFPFATQELALCNVSRKILFLRKLILEKIPLHCY